MASDTFTDEQIAQLMAMTKRVENPSAKSKNEGKHIRRDFRVVSTDGAHEFALFTRQSSLLPQGFSAGLRWLAKSGESVMLMRCNGSDHPHTNSIERDRFEPACHIHQATERYLAVGKKVEGYASLTTAYQTLEGALHHIVQLCNITGLKTEPCLSGCCPRACWVSKFTSNLTQNKQDFNPKRKIADDFRLF